MNLVVSAVVFGIAGWTSFALIWFSPARSEFSQSNRILDITDLVDVGGDLQWNCFNTEDLRFGCEYEEPIERQGSIFFVEIKSLRQLHSYDISHAISGEVCRELEEQTKKVTENEKLVCVQGSAWSRRLENGKPHFMWSFYKLKTKRGYAHFRLD